MAISPRLDLRQTQSLVMTPQLQQSIKLLQLSNLELASYVEEQLEQNPLLERDVGNEGAPEAESEWRDQEPGEAPASEAAPGDVAGLDIDYDNVWTNDSPADAVGPDNGAYGTWNGASGGNGGEAPDLEQTASESISLREHLVGQLNVDIVDPAELLIGLHLMAQLDESGYVPADLTPVAEQLGCTLQQVDEVLGKLQRFDPAGIFARDLAECLALQLRDRNRLDPAMQALLQNLQLVARRDVAALVKLCGVGADDVADMIAELKRLNPKPASVFETVLAQPVTPDILMRARPDGGWHIELDSDTLPRVLVNHRYYAEIQSQASNRADKAFISECFQSANWLTKALHQRAQTILKVATEIVRQQEAFFRHGVRALRPLVLRDIAEAISMHESTVSRVTTNKYIATPRGIFELKYFFTTSIGSTLGGDAHSAEAVRFRIRTMVEQERADAVLSDDRIVAILRSEGVDIARRTVAKYRESMRIPSSVRRRQEKPNA